MTPSVLYWSELALEVGLVLSIRTSTSIAAKLPALSVAVRFTKVVRPSAVTSSSFQQPAPSLPYVGLRPLSVSAQLKLTVTSLLFQPSAFGAGVRIAEIVGGVVSILTVSFAVWPLEALSETEQWTAWMPSPETETCQGLDVPVTVAGEPSTVQVGAPSRAEPESLALTATLTGSV